MRIVVCAGETELEQLLLPLQHLFHGLGTPEVGVYSN